MKTFWIILITVIIAGGLVGGGTYYYLNKKATDDKNTLQTQINNFNARITTLNNQLSIVTATAGWKTYSSTKYNFSFKYPTTWTLTENIESRDVTDKAAVSIMSPETESAFQNQINTANYSIIGNDISVYYYASLADEPTNKQYNLGATTIDQLFSRSNSLYKIGSVILGGIQATDLMETGEGADYNIFALKDSHLYNLEFKNYTKENLTNTQKLIISTFQFTK